MIPRFGRYCFCCVDAGALSENNAEADADPGPTVAPSIDVEDNDDIVLDVVSDSDSDGSEGGIFGKKSKQRDSDVSTCAGSLADSLPGRESSVSWVSLYGDNSIGGRESSVSLWSSEGDVTLPWDEGLQQDGGTGPSGVPSAEEEDDEGTGGPAEGEVDAASASVEEECWYGGGAGPGGVGPSPAPDHPPAGTDSASSGW